MHEITIAAQLYTVREEGARDFPATLAKVARLGYQNVELAGFGNLASATEACRALEAAGLRCVSAHVPLDQFESSLSRVLDDQAEIGNQNLVVPWVPEERRKTLADWMGIVKTLNQLGEACMERGFHLSYHHHDFEFKPLDGKTPFDLIWSETDPQLVHAADRRLLGSIRRPEPCPAYSRHGEPDLIAALEGHGFDAGSTLCSARQRGAGPSKNPRNRRLGRRAACDRGARRNLRDAADGGAGDELRASQIDRPGLVRAAITSAALIRCIELSQASALRSVNDSLPAWRPL